MSRVGLASSDPPCNAAVKPAASLAGSATTTSSPFARIRSMPAANNASSVEIAMGCATRYRSPLCAQLATSGTAEVRHTLATNVPSVLPRRVPQAGGTVRPTERLLG